MWSAAGAQKPGVRRHTHQTLLPLPRYTRYHHSLKLGTRALTLVPKLNLGTQTLPLVPTLKRGTHASQP